MHCNKLGEPSARQNKPIEQHCGNILEIKHGANGPRHSLRNPAALINAQLATMTGTGPQHLNGRKRPLRATEPVAQRLRNLLIQRLKQLQLQLGHALPQNVL